MNSWKYVSTAAAARNEDRAHYTVKRNERQGHQRTKPMLYAMNAVNLDTTQKNAANAQEKKKRNQVYYFRR